jgi:hypothetical protein
MIAWFFARRLTKKQGVLRRDGAGAREVQGGATDKVQQTDDDLDLGITQEISYPRANRDIP